MSNLDQFTEPDVSQSSYFPPLTLFSTEDSASSFEDGRSSEWRCQVKPLFHDRSVGNPATSWASHPDYSLNTSSSSSRVNSLARTYSQEVTSNNLLTLQDYVNNAIQRLEQASFLTPQPQALVNVNKHFDQLKSPPEKRRHKRKCLGCVTHAKKPPCVDHPRCQNCKLLRPLKVEPTTPKLHEVFYLDWKAWFKVCEDLGHKFIPFDRLRSQLTEAIKLQLSFSSGQCAGNTQKKITTILLSEINDQCQFEETVGDHSRSIKAPIANFDDFDGFVANVLWCKHCEIGHYRMLSGKETALFSAVKLFAGYFSLIHNLPNTVISSSGLYGSQIIRFTAAALAYSFVFKLQKLFTEIAVLCDDLTSEMSQEKHPATVFYALETLYRFMIAAPQTPWDIPSTDHALHPLVRLQHAFLKRSKNLKDRILDYECLYSGLDEKACRMQLHSMVKFARDAEFKLPCQLRVTAEAYMNPETSNQQMNYMPWISEPMTAVDALSDASPQDFEITYYNAYLEVLEF